MHQPLAAQKTCLRALIVLGAAVAATPLASQEAVDRAAVLERFLASEGTSLVSYKALRKLSVVARGGKMQASLTARTSLDSEGGFHYEVLDEEGSGFLRSRVLHPVLEAERQARLRDKGTHGALTRANYVFTVRELSGELLQVGIKPRRKDELLMDGSMYLSCDEADLLRVEGMLVKRPSFWTRKVHIDRLYTRIGGARVPIATQSTAEVLFVGQSSFSMAYEYESINGVAVASGDARGPATGVR
jgi:hypothetical protein